MSTTSSLHTHRTFPRAYRASWLTALLLLAFPGLVRAQFPTPKVLPNGIVYSTNMFSDGIMILGYQGPLADVVIPDIIDGSPVTLIVPQAFYASTNVKSITIPDSVFHIGEHAFIWSSSLTSVIIGNGVTDLYSDAFGSCPNLVEAKLGKNITSNPHGAFWGCRNLTAVIVDPLNPFFNSLDGALYNKDQTRLLWCPSGIAGTFTIPPTVTQIDGAFDEAFRLNALAVDSSNAVYSSIDGVLFSKDQTVLISYPKGRTGAYTVPGTVKRIGNGAFSLCAGLTAVAMSNSVGAIGEGAFGSCSNLVGLVIDESVTNIDASAFGYCTTLTSVAIPDSVISVGGGAFYNCPNLTNLTVGKNVTRLLAAAFGSCGNLTSIYFRGNAPGDLGDQFRNDPRATVYYLPGTIGWGTTFGGAPAVLWNPLAQSPRVMTGEFRFGITGPSNQTFVVEACANLSTPAWFPVSTNTFDAAGISAFFTDSQSGSFSQRFYRFRSP